MKKAATTQKPVLTTAPAPAPKKTMPAPALAAVEPAAPKKLHYLTLTGYGGTETLNVEGAKGTKPAHVVVEGKLPEGVHLTGTEAQDGIVRVRWQATTQQRGTSVAVEVLV